MGFEWKNSDIGTRLGEAMIALLKERNIESISVKMICDRTGINRSTFYNYFDNKYQLCDAVMNASIEVFIEKFEEHVSKLAEQKEVLRPEQYLASSGILIYYLELVREYRDVFEVFAMSQGKIYSKDQYLELIENIVLPILKQYNINDPRQAEYMASFYLGSIHSVVLSWIKNDCEESVEYIAETIRRCLRIPENFMN